MVFFPFAVLLVVFLFILQIDEILDTVMQYKAEGEKAAMVPNLDTYVSRALSMAEDPQIRRTRKTLLIILGIFFVSALLFYCWMTCKSHFSGLYFRLSLWSVCFLGALQLLARAIVLAMEQVHRLVKGLPRLFFMHLVY